MTRTFIFDSADPDASNFVDEGTESEEEVIDEDFLSFEDDLQTSSDSTTSSSDSDASDKSRALSRFRSRTSTIGDRSERYDSSSDSDGKFVRALKAVKSGGASVLNRRGGGSDGEGSTPRRKRRKRRRRRRSEDLAAVDEGGSVQIINNQHQQEMISIPFPGVLNTPAGGADEQGQVVFGADVKLSDDGSEFRTAPELTPQVSGLRRRKSGTKAPEEAALNTGTDFGGVPTRPKRASSQKRSLRRYSGSMGSAAAAQRRAGWEPGVDIRTTDIILQSIGSAVTIVDYSVTRYRIIQTEVYPAPKTDDSDTSPSLVVNKEFHDHLESRPAWSEVRWISVNGLSWEAISAISKKYQLHRLAIEDMVDIPQRTKVDLYPTHTFCCLPLHKLIPFKPQHVGGKKDDSFFDWVLGRKEEKKKKKFSASKLWPAKSNTSTSSKRRTEEKNITISSNETKESSPMPSLPVQPPGITLPADSGRRRPISHAGPPNRKNVLPNSSSSSSSSSSSDNEDDHKPLNQILAAKGMETIYDWNNPYAAIQQKNAYIESKRPLAEYKRAVGVEQVSLFLTSQSTVISFFERSAVDIERPLLARLSTESTILRESCDPSLLLQAIVDAIVDLLQPIIAAYRRRMDELLVDSMINPSMAHTQDLHLMAGELSMLRNTIVPITSLVLSLRDHTPAPPIPTDPNNPFINDHRPQNGGARSKSAPHGMQPGPQPGHIKIPIISQGNMSTGTANDPTNAAVAAAVAAASTSMAATPSSSSSALPTPKSDTPPAEPIMGSRISALAKVYLADISDHLLSHTQDLDVMRGNTKNMIDLIFNTISIQSSDSIKQLSFVTVVFLPLSFWTGYFGMNFTEFGVLENTPGYYWYIAIPFSVGVLFLAMLVWIKQAFFRTKNFVKKRVRKHQRKVKKQMRKKARRRELSHV